MTDHKIHHWVKHTKGFYFCSICKTKKYNNKIIISSKIDNKIDNPDFSLTPNVLFLMNVYGMTLNKALKVYQEAFLENFDQSVLKNEVDRGLRIE